MKETRHILISCFILFLSSLIPIYGQTYEMYDSIEMSLLTCEPHQEVYSLYGHTALRVNNLSDGRDFVVNYGVFNMNAPHFILRFAFGLTDYEMGIMPFEAFCREYKYYGSGVIQQDLNLTSKEKHDILNAIYENSLPENVVYRYNYFYDNCTTRARNIVVDHLSRQVTYPSSADTTATYRGMVHQYNGAHPWSRFGIDLLLGVKSDVNTSALQRQFLPDNLRKDFDQAVLTDSDGTTMPFVRNSYYVVQPGLQVVEREFPLRPVQCAWLLLVLTVVVIVSEWMMKKKLWFYDLLLMLVTGLSGIIIFAMIFSQQPTVNLNLQILLLNPLPLFFIYPVIRRARKQQTHLWWKIWTLLTCLFLAGALIQTYAEGMLIAGVAVLLRCLSQWRSFTR